MPPPIEASEVVSTAGHNEESLPPAPVRLPSWAQTQAEAAVHEDTFRAVAAVERRRMPSVISRSAGVIATKRVAATAMWTPRQKAAMQPR